MCADCGLSREEFQEAERGAFAGGGDQSRHGASGGGSSNFSPTDDGGQRADHVITRKASVA
jgi:hypothetical protein